MKKLLILLSITATMYAKVSPENILTSNCLHSYLSTYKNLKNHKAFVYARENDTGKDRCNWGYGYNSIEEAIESAMKGCRSVVLNAECKVIDRDGSFDVPKGAFTKLIPIDETPLSKEESELLIKEAKGVVRGNCLPFFKKYLKDKGHKAFAYSLDSDGKYACGKTYRHSILAMAKKEAIKGCKNHKNILRSKAPKSPCRVYAVDKKIVLNLSDYGIKQEPKKDKFLSSDEYDKRLTLAKEIIDKGACLIQMKYYLRGKTQQAFYFAKSGTKQACGRKEEAFTIKQAKEEAKKSCEKMARQKGIKSDCKLLALNYEIVGKPSDFDKVKESKEDFENAIHKGNITKIKAYIKKGYDVNTESKKDGITPLFVAAAKGDKELFENLLKKGADIMHRSKDGSTVLIASALGDNIEIAKKVLDKGVDVNAKGFGGNTALHVAVMKMSRKMVKLLKDNGADESITNNKGNRASIDLLLNKSDKNKSNKKERNLTKLTSIDKPTTLSKALKITSENINKKLPVMIDNEIRFDKVVANGKKMSFIYTLIHINSKNMPASKLKELVYEDIKREVCNDKETTNMLKQGMIVDYIYNDKERKPIATFTFNAKSCGYLTNVEQLKKNIFKMIDKK